MGVKLDEVYTVIRDGLEVSVQRQELTYDERTVIVKALRLEAAALRTEVGMLQAETEVQEIIRAGGER